jgi:hypothetical protein
MKKSKKHKSAFYQFFELWLRHKAMNKIAGDEGEEVGRHKATNKIAGDEGEKVGRHKPTNKLCMRTMHFRAPITGQPLLQMNLDALQCTEV